MRSLRGGSILLASVGAEAYRVRLTIFVISALLAGVAGWLYAHSNRFVSPAPFDVLASINYLLMALVGGVGTLAGAPFGAAIILLLRDIVQDLLPSQLESVVFAGLFILMLHFARGGLMRVVKRVMPASWFKREIIMGKGAAAPALAGHERPAPGAPILVVDGATKKFGGLTAVDNVSFGVNAGEIVGLIGPNGAGKSTMFNLLTCTLPMTSGRVTFLGQDVTSLPQRQVARMGLARTFQHVKLRPRMSLLENVALGAHSRTHAGVLRAGLRLDREEEARIFQEAFRQLERVGLGHRANDMAGSLPLGMQRILEIARALASDPVLLVLDEPAAGLRQKEKEALGELLQGLRTDGVTILIVEHDMDFVMNLVDRLVVMHFGSKLAQGAPADVRANEQVQAAYLGVAQ